MKSIVNNSLFRYSSHPQTRTIACPQAMQNIKLPNLILPWSYFSIYSPHHSQVYPLVLASSLLKDFTRKQAIKLRECVGFCGQG